MDLLRSSLLLVLVLAQVSAWGRDVTCEFKAHQASVKVFLDDDEIMMTDVKPGAASAYLGLLGMPDSLQKAVKSELFIANKTIHLKSLAGQRLSKQEEDKYVRYLIVGVDQRTSESDLKAIKISALGMMKDSDDFKRRQSETIARMGKAGLDVSAYTPEVLSAVGRSASDIKVVSESDRHVTLDVLTPEGGRLISYVLAESRMVCVLHWYSPDEREISQKKFESRITLIESQTRKWDGDVTGLGSFSGKSFSGPDGMFSYRCAGKWQPASTKDMPNPYPPGVRYSMLQYPERTQGGVYPVITILHESAQSASVNEYWDHSLKLISGALARGEITDVSVPRSYPATSGWPALMLEYNLNRKVPTKCRLVIMMVGKNQFLTATIMTDKTASDEVTETALQCVESIDTPDSPRQKALR